MKRSIASFVFSCHGPPFCRLRTKICSPHSSLSPTALLVFVIPSAPAPNAPSSLLAEVRSHSQDVNLLNLQRRDAAIVAIAFVAKFCCAYQMQSDGQWAKRDIEGPLFVVARFVLLLNLLQNIG